MIKCKECKYFKRGKWHKVIDPNESPQLGGYCDKLLRILQMTNSKLIWIDNLYIQEEFGCILGEKNQSTI